MIFLSLIFSTNGNVTAEAVGHPTDVVENFRKVASLLLSERGPWRITKVGGKCDDLENLDSDMHWWLEAKLKNPDFDKSLGIKIC